MLSRGMALDTLSNVLLKMSKASGIQVEHFTTSMLLDKDVITGSGEKLIKNKYFSFYFSVCQICQRRRCLYDKHRRRWPNLDKVGKFGKH